LHVLQREHLPAGEQQQLLYVLRRTLKPRLAMHGTTSKRGMRLPALRANFSKLLNTGHLIPRCAVVLGYLRFDHDARTEFMTKRATQEL
jgi:hypothetical protein